MFSTATSAQSSVMCLKKPPNEAAHKQLMYISCLLKTTACVDETILKRIKEKLLSEDAAENSINSQVVECSLLASCFELLVTRVPELNIVTMAFVWNTKRK